MEESFHIVGHAGLICIDFHPFFQAVGPFTHSQLGEGLYSSDCGSVTRHGWSMDPKTHSYFKRKGLIETKIRMEAQKT